MRNNCGSLWKKYKCSVRLLITAKWAKSSKLRVNAKVNLSNCLLCCWNELCLTHLQRWCIQAYLIFSFAPCCFDWMYKVIATPPSSSSLFSFYPVLYYSSLTITSLPLTIQDPPDICGFCPFCFLFFFFLFSPFTSLSASLSSPEREVLNLIPRQCTNREFIFLHLCSPWPRGLHNLWAAHVHVLVFKRTTFLC